MSRSNILWQIIGFLRGKPLVVKSADAAKVDLLLS